MAIVAVLLLQLAAFGTQAHAASAPKSCDAAIGSMNKTLVLIAKRRVAVRTAKKGGAKKVKKAKKALKTAQKQGNQVRAAIKTYCIGSGGASALDAQCALTIGALEKTINLQYSRKLAYKKIKGHSKKAKKRKRVMKTQLKKLADTVKAQTSDFKKSCGNSGSSSNGNGGSNGGSNGGDAGGAKDTTPPGAVTIDGPTTTNTDTPAYTITPPAGETGGHIECKIDDGEYATVTSPWTVPTLSDGVHTITCRYVDEAGNAGDPTTVTVTVDTTPPADGPGINVPGSGDNGENNGDNPVVVVTPPSGETGGHTECKISGNGYDGNYADFTTVTSPWTIDEVLPEGTYTITCHYVDEAGNQGPDTTYTITIDRTAPGAPSVSGPGNPTNDSTPQITVTTTEAGGTVKCSVDGGSYNVVTSPFSTGELNDGAHTVSCTQTDAAGNTSDAGTATVVIDTTAPGAPGISGPSGATSDTTPSFNLTGAGQGETYWCKTDGGSFVQTGAVYTTAVLADGGHTVTCHIVDAAGNTGADASAGVSIDSKAPGSVTISGPTVTNNPTPTITITSSETGGHIDCKIDSGAFQTVTSPWKLPTLSEGVHTVTCHYVSHTGVNGPDSTYTVTIDTTAPSAVTISGPSGTTNDNTPTYTLAGGSGGTYQCKVDGGSYAAATSPFTTAALPDGGHTVTCRAIDLAGNTTPEVSKTVTVDTTAPTLTITDGAPRWDGKHDFTISSSEAGTTYRCKIDAGSYAATTTPYTTGVLANGAHTFTCIGTDAAGNAAAPVVKNFGVFKDPVTTSRTGGFQWGIACTPNAVVNAFLGCPDETLTITIPANPNGLTGSYLADISGKVNGLCNLVGIGSTYSANLAVDGNKVAGDSASSGIDLLCMNKKNLSAAVSNISLSASSSHTITISLKSSALICLLPRVDSSSLTVSIHH